MTNRIAVAAAICLFFAESVSGQVRSSDLRVVETDAEIERLLDQKRNMVFYDATLEDVCAELTACGIPTYIDKQALEDYGIATDTPVDFHQSAIRTRYGLDLLLRTLDLAWGVRNGRLVITTEEEAECDLITKVYDVRNLVELVPVPYWGGVLAGNPPTLAYQYDFDSLIELITSTVRPDSWDFVGGPGAIQPCYTRRMRAIAISQTYEIHQQVKALLGALAEVGGTSPLSSTTVLHHTSRLHRSALESPFGSSGGIRASQLRATAR
jgi:hypothetical protein